ncbi:MAG: type II secretion system protein [Chthoniobacterales bacterium]|jgi:prepilin-type N-terminal cleavage/methylation domain-containing protein|nr:type II secretion system protein [Chthoniobacterales bacterium]
MKRNPHNAFTLIELLVVIAIIAVLASIALPVFTTVQERGAQTKDLSNAKQIGLGLKLYAGDNDGKFPVVAAAGASNDAFAQLIPQYVPTEKIFYLAKSKWTPASPDEVFGVDANGAPTTDTLKAAENNFAYVNNLSDTSNPNFPLIADGFSTTVGTYTNVETDKGGVWKGKKAIVVRADQSGAVEKCTSDYKVVGKTGAATDGDIFATSATWLSATQTPINPK